MSLRDPNEIAIWTSTDDAYARLVNVYPAKETACDVCKDVTLCLSVDTSEDEYLRFTCCRHCIADLFDTAMRTKT